MLSILNLYCGIGGNRYKWDGDIHVTAVDINEEVLDIYAELNPNDTIICGDAHSYLLDNAHDYDFIWASPPCQTHTRMQWGKNRTPKYPDMSLYQEIIYLQTFYNGKFCVENVKPYYAPLIPPTITVGRHLFWTNFWFHAEEIKQPKDFMYGTMQGKKDVTAWLGMPYIERNVYLGSHDPGQPYRNCVHPDLGEAILSYVTKKDKVEENSLFSERGYNA